MAPDRNLPSGVKQVVKPTDPKALFAQSPVKAFDMRVLRGLARLDMYQLDLSFNAPGQKMTAGQFGAVVAANRLWFSTSLDDLVQRAGHAPAGKAGINFQREALARVGIDHPGL